MPDKPPQAPEDAISRDPEAEKVSEARRRHKAARWLIALHAGRRLAPWDDPPELVALAEDLGDDQVAEALDQVAYCRAVVQRQELRDRIAAGQAHDPQPRGAR